MEPTTSTTVILESTTQKSQGVQVEFDDKLKKFSKDIVGLANEGENIPVDIDAETLNIIKRFLEEHDYNPENIKITRPLKSDKLEDHLDEKSYELFREYYGPENADKIKPIVDAAYFLNIEELKQAALLTLGCPFYLGSSEQEKMAYKEKWGIGDLTPEEERQIIDENKPVFDQVNQMFSERMDEEQRKFEEAMKQKQQQEANNQNQN